MKTIDTETLRTWLVERRPVTVLDMHLSSDWMEWAIPLSAPGAATPRSLANAAQDALPLNIVHGYPIARLPNTLTIRFPGINAAVLPAAIRSVVACFTGSACHAGHQPHLLVVRRASYAV